MGKTTGMVIIFPLALAALAAVFAGTACSNSEDKIIIGPEPLPPRQKSKFSKEEVHSNNPILNQTPVPFTEQTKTLFLFPLSKKAFEEGLSPEEKLSFRKLHYKSERFNFFTEVYSFAKQLKRNGKQPKAREVFQRLLEEKFPVPLEIRNWARRDLAELYQNAR